MGVFKPVQSMMRAAAAAVAILVPGAASSAVADEAAVPYVQNVEDGFDFTSGSWKQALLIDRFLEPGAFRIMGKAFAQDSTVATQVYLLRTKEALYFGVVCHDSDGMARKGVDGGQQVEIPAGNKFEFFIDGDLNDQQGFYQFIVNPAGDQWFARAGITRPLGKVECAVRQEEKTWKIRLRIPYHEIGIEPDCDEVHINLFRNYQPLGKGEPAKYSTWEGAAISTFSTLRPLTLLPVETP